MLNIKTLSNCSVSILVFLSLIGIAGAQHYSGQELFSFNSRVLMAVSLVAMIHIFCLYKSPSYKKFQSVWLPLKAALVLSIFIPLNDGFTPYQEVINYIVDKI